MTPWITKPVPFNIGQGAAAGEAPCVEATYNNLPSESLTGRILGINREAGGFRPDSGHVLYEKLIKSVTFTLDADFNSPNSTIYVRVRDSSDSIVDTFGTMLASGLTDTPTEYTFDTTEIQMSAGDYITCEYGNNTPAIQTRVYMTETSNYITNASTLVTTDNFASWIDWRDTYPPFNWYWMWLEVVYCE